MPRTARLHSSTGMYHIILRGVNQQDIFEDDEDRQMFLVILEECLRTAYTSPYIQQEECLRVYNYCLMTNHVHLLCREILTSADEAKLSLPIGTNQKIGISATMHRLGRKYSMWFNKKYGRTGHLFQDRFTSEPVEDNTYFLNVFRYIARNPYKAGIVADPDDYLWSGWYEYLHPTHDAWLQTTALTERWTLTELSDMVHSEPEMAVMDCENIPRAVPDAHLKQLLFDTFGHNTVADIQRLPSEQQKLIARYLIEQGAGIKQASRLTGVTQGTIRYALGYRNRH